jgi:predicted solute-binding protein
VASVALFTKVPVRQIRSLALDTSSRTSVALTRILCARRFEIAPTLTRHAPDLTSMLVDHDAALLIGDPALFVDHDGIGHGHVEKIDLGQAWTEMTGLPFVWAFWAGRAGVLPPTAAARMQDAKAAGMAISDTLADAYVAATPKHRDRARRYLRESVRFDLTARMLDGLRTYYREAAALGIIAEAVEPRLFDLRVAAGPAR